MRFESLVSLFKILAILDAGFVVVGLLAFSGLFLVFWVMLFGANEGVLIMAIALLTGRIKAKV